MNVNVSFHSSAEAELIEAADYYDKESPGLGNIFIDEIQKIVEIIRRFPESCPLLLDRVRRKTVLKFPYSIIYSMRGNKIRILAISHNKRRPFYWHGRVR
jgi:plasmid stabilization system protein ParE